MSETTHGILRHGAAPKRGRRLGRLAPALLALLAGIAPALAATVTFRQGENAYTGTQDTFLQQNPPNTGTNNGAAVAIGWDGDDPGGSGFDVYALLRFDAIIGNGAGQVPPGATITSATLRYVVTDVGDVGELRDVSIGWTEASTFSTFCGGGSCGGSEWGPIVANATAAAAGAQTIVVTASVQAWANGTTNNGWIVIPTANGGVDVDSSEAAAVANRPLLTVTYNEGPPQANLVRQPYLQLSTPSSMTIVWRTDTASDSRVRYGTVQGVLDQSASNAAVSTNHVVTINTNLSPSTRYYYDVGSTTAVQAGGTANHYFETSPPPAGNGPFRAWVLGDSGNGSSQQTAVRDAMLAFTAANPPDLFIHMGDIAYTVGSDDEFTTNHFGVYQDIMRRTPFWPTLGNHEGASTTSGQPGASNGPYYDAFVLPTGAEAGGTASGTEAYYSWDYGNTHFIVLNSYQVNRAANGPMAQWLQADLAATDKQWTIAYWHHPPYSKGTHNSDTETELVEMRQNIVPLLEAGGVDLVLSGHSHTYERSYLIDGTYTTPTPNFGTLESTGKIIDDGDGKPTGDGSYLKNAGANPHEGAVYVVAGHGGAGTGGSLNHPVMYYSETNHGSCILDIDANTITLTNVRSTGVVSDSFTIQKGDLPPRVASANPPKSAVLSALGPIQVTFSEPVSGVDAGDLTVDGSVATSMTGAAGSAGPYTFSDFAPPGNGAVSVALAPGGIASVANPGLVFPGDTWTYSIDTNPPVLADEAPARGSEMSFLSSITVDFSKPVTGVAAGDLTVNGSPADFLSGISGSSGPYTFSGYAVPPTGLVSVALAAGATEDDQGQDFAGDAWSYSLRPGLVINEFLASNNTTVTDENGEFDDYLEVYNPANTPVDMGGMSLTDSLGFAQQYQIPAGVVIPAHGHLIFWCDSQPAQGPMHTNFNLLRTGEQIGLFASEEDGFGVVDQLTYATQTTDVPVGRFPDGQGPFVPMPETPGARNTISCSVNGECAALADQCNVGVCSGNLCVPQPANEGAACDDGIACRAPDTCTAGVCDGGPDTCTGGLTCNLITGLCEAEVEDPLPIPVGATWRYFKGTTAPDPAWITSGYDDSGWLTGASGFGYGTDCASGRATTLTDMQSPPATPGYPSLFVRRTFHVDNPALVTSLTLTIDYDDAFVAYVNGEEVGRNNVVGLPPANTALATADRECSTGSPANPAQVVVIDPAVLDPGTNVIAIQGHNVTLGSSDFTLTPALTSTEATGCTTPAECNDGNACTDDACSAGVCENTSDDGNACSDGIACTADTCTSGACVSVPNCPGGQTCNTGTGLCQGGSVTLGFQNGVNGYGGTVDTYIDAALGSQAIVSPIVIDGTPEEHGLLRFDGIFGAGPNQIPAGSTITSATLTLWVGAVANDQSATAINLHRLLNGWVDTDIWAAYGVAPWNAAGGIQADGTDAVAASSGTATMSVAANAYPINVTTSLQAWTGAPSSNLGWAILPTGTDGLRLESAESTTASNTRRPALSVTFTPPVAGCTTDPDCDDGNPCTDDVCNAGTCANPNDDANVCTDGVACTSDACSSGACVSVPNCPGGQSCNTGTGLCEFSPVSVSFQQGTGGYTGATDTFLHAGAADANNGAAVTLVVDGTPAAADERQTLLRFDSVFTSQGGPIPDGATIVSATLRLNITNPSADGAELHRMLVPWTASSTWNTLVGGVQRDGVDSVAAIDVTSLFNGTVPALHTIDVTSSLAAWSTGAARQGWVLVTPAGGDDSWQFDSAEGATVANRPRLTVQYTTGGGGCSVPADCDDGNACNGVETCVASVCQPGTPLNCNDGNVCTTDSCDTVTGCVNTNNTLACSDGNACTSGDTCAAGACSGTAITCNDGVACTADSCDTGTGCVYTSLCGVGQTCNTGTGLCEGGSATLSFQNGVGGYGGTVDTYVDTALGSQATASPIVVDGTPEEHVLLRFDGIFGAGPNQIPAGSTITSATLTLWVGAGANDQSATAINLHRLLNGWVDTDVWAAYGVAPWNTAGGIQADGTDAVAANSGTATMSVAATAYPINVTTSLQAWTGSPASNFGWAILPTGTDGLRLESAESTTASSTRRPALSVTFTPPVTGCTTDPDCDDGNPCTDDVCNAGTCSNANDDGNACTDGVACTSDACASGACVSVPNCPGGQTCNLTSGLCETTPTTSTFQQGTGGYAGALDTFLHAGAPDANNGAAVTLVVDGTPAAADERQTLLRFDSIFTSQGGPIPDGATIVSATLRLNITNPSADGAELHRMLAPWTASSSWNTLVGGVQRDGVDAVAAADASSLYNGTVPALHTIDVTSSLAAWSAGAARNGWVLVTPAAGDDSWQFDSAEGATVANRPLLSVTYSTLAGARGQLRCDPAGATAAPGGSVAIDVLLDDLTGLAGIRGYQTQVSVALTSGTGTASIACPGGVQVNEARADYLFAGQAPTFPAVNCPLKRATSSLQTGSVTAGPAADYLSSYTVGISLDAAPGSTFEVTVLPAPDSALADAAGDPVDFAVAPVCTITVAGCGTPADCDDGNPCTDDVCDAGVCSNPIDDANVCSDGDACTVGDSCLAGVCVGAPLNCDDGNVCTTDVCVAGSCTHPASGACTVTGNVSYYRDAAGSSEPSVKPVPGVSIDGTSDQLSDDVTDAAGAYSLSNQAGNLTVATLPKLGSPRASDENGAITSFDASVIAQASVGGVTLSANQQIAGDVTGNSEVTSFDAAKVAQYAVGLVDHFDVAIGTGSDWRFFRCDNYASASSQDCGAPQYVFAPITGPSTANFHTVLFGDVTGNWEPAPGPAPARASGAAEGERLAAQRDRDEGVRLRAGAARSRVWRSGPAVLSFTGGSGPLAAGERRTLLLHVANAGGIAGVDLALRYDPSRLRIVDMKTVDLASGWGSARHDVPEGTRVALYGVLPLEGAGAVLSVTVEAIGPVTRPAISIDATANEGTIPLRIERTPVRPRKAGPAGEQD